MAHIARPSAPGILHDAADLLMEKAVIADEVLPDALGTESLIELAQNDAAKRRTLARVAAG